MFDAPAFYLQRELFFVLDKRVCQINKCKCNSSNDLEERNQNKEQLLTLKQGSPLTGCC